MSLRLYMDEHVPRAITDGLRARGVDLITAQGDGRAGSSDSELIERAGTIGRILVSFDYDMFREAALRQSSARTFTGIIHIRAGLSIGRCIDEVHLVCEAMSEAETAGCVFRIPL